MTGPPLRVARVAVDLPLAHLDRPFDYAIPDALADDVAPGVRCRVRFAGQRLEGFVLEVTDRTEVTGGLASLQRVVSPEVVLTPTVAQLVRVVADHWAGTFADVVRLAVPPRHAAAEKAQRPRHPAPLPAEGPGVLARHSGGDTFLAGLAEGRPVRAAWTCAPTAGPAGDWPGGLLDAVLATLAAGRGALVIVPDADALAVLEERWTPALGAGSFVTLHADAGPAARYRAFLAAVRGDVRLVIGTRSAVYAPVADLGLVAVWDEGSDSYAEPRAPYPHTREVAALRSTLEPCGLLLAGHGRTAEVQALIERGWVGELALTGAEVRRHSPLVRAAADTDRALAADPAARAARLPHDVFAGIRAGLASGPVLLHVPLGGYLSSLACQRCRTAARCPRCGGPLRGERGATCLSLTCATCGPVEGVWRCSACGSAELRAPRVGVRRTAEELGRAFPQVRVVQSWAGHRVAQVPDEPALVLATPGAEPRADGGYSAAVLLDADLLPTRPELRAEEEAVRRWLSVCGLVRPADRGGTVLVVGDPQSRAVQALIRLDAPGFAARELAERTATHFPPTARLVHLEGDAGDVAAFEEAWSAVPGVEAFGPVPTDDGVRLTVRVPLRYGRSLVDALVGVQAGRTARKEPPVRVRVDPQVIG